MNKLVKNIFLRNPIKSNFNFLSYIPSSNFSETRTSNQPKSDAFVLAAPFYALLSKLQLNKDKENSSTLNAWRTELIKNAETIVSDGKYDPKLLNNLTTKLHQENLFSEKILSQLLTTIENLTYDQLHKLDFHFVVIILKQLRNVKVDANITQIKQIQSLIIYILSNSQWGPAKEFLDVVASKDICEKIFNQEIEEKIVKMLNYARTQIGNLSFFISLMESGFNCISITNDRFKLKKNLEQIMETKIVEHPNPIDIKDLGTIINFFSEDYTLSNSFFLTIAPVFFESKIHIDFNAFKKFLRVAAINNYNISQNPPDYLYKILSYINRVSTLEELKLFSPYLKYYTPSQNSILTQNISIVIGKFLKYFFKSPNSSLNELLLLKFYMETTDTRGQSELIIEQVNKFVQKNKDALSLSSMAVISLLSNYLPTNKQDKFKEIEEVIISRFSKENIKSIDKETINSVKQFMQSYYYTEDMSANKKSILSKIEILLKDHDFQRRLQFNDLHELLQFLYFAFMNKIANKPFSTELWDRYKEPFFKTLKFEEIIFILPKAARLQWILHPILQSLNQHIEKILPANKLTLSSHVRLLNSISSFENQVINDREIRKSIKTFWFACENSFCEIITITTKRTKVKNPFLETWDNVNEVKTATINPNLTKEQLDQIFEIYSYVLKWNIGSKAIFDSYCTLSSHYFNQIEPADISRIAYSLAKINSSKLDTLQERLESYVLEKKFKDPLDYIRVAWYFAIKGNQNQPLWTTLVSEISKLGPVTEQPVELMLNLYELLFMIRVEISSVKIHELEKFFEDLDAIWAREYKETIGDFKEKISKVLEDECYILQPKFKASLYECDYVYGEKDVVLILPENCFLGNTGRELGHVTLKKRILKGLGYDVHVIDRINFENKRKHLEKMDYIKKQMTGIPIDKVAWTKKQKMKGIFF